MFGENEVLREDKEDEERFAADAEPDLIGKSLGNYVIERPLARGGMGSVYVARHPALDRLAAVKFLSEELSDSPGLAKRFLDEARVTAQLRHPNIVEIFDFGAVDGHYYYVMELLRGQDLATYLLGKGTLPTRLVVRCVEQICSALNAAHSAGVIHRDLKPGNVFVVEESPLRVKLVDFGVAKVSSRDTAQTHYGQIIGTPTHMSPEQALGYTDKISPRSDLYSLGVIAYEMLTGQPVFQHDSEIMLMMMHIRDPIVPIRELAPNVSEAVASVFESCLAKDPADRPGSALELVERLATATGDSDYLQRLSSRAPVTPTVAEAKASEQRRSAKIGGDRVVLAREPATVVAVAPARGVEPGDAPPSLAESASSADSEPAPPSADAEPVPPSADAEPVPPSADAEPAPPSADAEPAPPSADAEPAPPSDELEGRISEVPESERGTGEPIELNPSERSTLGRILQRMQCKGDFPAFVRSVGEVSKKADAEGAYSARQLGDSILKDYALTAKLLRIVNYAYAHRFGGKVFSVQHAIVILGFDRVRSIAMSISLFKSSGSRRRSKRVTDSAISALVTGEIARSLSPEAGVEDSEQAMICGMFRNLGHHLVVVYLADEYDRMLELRETDGLTLEAAARRVLGLSLRKIGVGIAEKWRLPERMLAAMAVEPAASSALTREAERLSALAEFSTNLCEIVSSESPGTWDDSLTDLLSKNRNLIRLDKEQVPLLLRNVHESFENRYSSLGLNPKLSRFSHNVATLPPASPDVDFDQAARASHVAKQTAQAGGRKRAMGSTRTGKPRGKPVVAPLQLAKRMGGVSITETPGSSADASGARLDPNDLERRVDDLFQALSRKTPPDRVLVAGLELLSKHLGLPRILAFVSDAANKELSVRAAIGQDAEALRAEVRFPLLARRASGDVFSSAYHSGKDVIIEDAFAGGSTSRVPARYYEALGSAAFVLISCVKGGRTRAVLLADSEETGAVPDAEALATIASLRRLIAQSAR